jgi:hypothetical protein
MKGYKNMAMAPETKATGDGMARNEKLIKRRKDLANAKAKKRSDAAGTTPGGSGGATRRVEGRPIGRIIV